MRGLAERWAAAAPARVPADVPAGTRSGLVSTTLASLAHWAEREGVVGVREAVVVEAARFLAARCGEPVHLADVADHVGYSPFHLARAFRAQVGVPPGEFLLAHRLHRAKLELLRGDDRVLDVCTALGFASLGTFSARFTAAVGLSPVRFRQLPDVLADHPPRPITLTGGVPGGGSVSGVVRLSGRAAAALGGAPAVYVGLFSHRAPRGVPVAGSLLAEPGAYLLPEVPVGTYWVLAAALPAAAGVLEQLIPVSSVRGAAERPVRISGGVPHHRREVVVDLAQDWAAPVAVALPALACPTAQDRRRQRSVDLPTL